MAGIMTLQNNHGFGLIELLILSSISLFAGLGAFKITELAVKNTLISNTNLEGQDLIASIRKAFNEQCKDNLKPLNLSDPTNKKGNIKSLTFLTADQNKDLNTKPVNFKNNGLINIIKTDLKDDDNNHKRFTVYFTKPVLGMQERQRTLILSMLKNGASINFVSKVTGLSEKEIEKLKN